MSKVLFQWVDGGILRQFQLEKNTAQYRTLMAVVNEVKQSLEENAAVTAQTIPASNEVHGQQAVSPSPSPAVSPLPDSVNQTEETAAAADSRPGSEPPTTIRTPVKKIADNRQWSFCDNCKANGGKSQYIYGTRFKCAVCTNFDLCEACEASGVHAHHVMLRIGLIVKDEIGWSSSALKPLHNELKNFCAKLTAAPLSPGEGKDKNLCDECNVQLTGGRLNAPFATTSISARHATRRTCTTTTS
ncbi:Protein C06G3.6 [Aphelenchoides avenae]|nr:Protein C06G3.6 [Aphelenchus avenae]